MRIHTRAATATAIVLVLVSLTVVWAQTTAATGVSTLGLPGRSNDHVTAASAGAFVALAWAVSTADGGADIYVAVSGDAALSFSAPVRVNAIEGQAQVNGEQPPRVLIVTRSGGARDVVVVWPSKGANGTTLLTARSSDDGRSFGRTSIVPGTDAAGNRGWHSIAAGTDGRVSALWLDHRDTAPRGGGTAMHQHGAATAATAAPAAAAAPSTVDGAARARLSQLYFGSLDGSLSARSIARGVCYCCKTAVIAEGGVVYAAWRHVYAGNHRDIAFAMSRDGGHAFSEPVRISEDDWQLDGCPENGPTIAVDAERRVHVIWPTLVTEGGKSTLKLFHAATTDGRVFTRREALPTTGAAYHPQMVVAADRSLMVVWDEAVAGRRAIRLARRGDGAGGRIDVRTLSGPAESGVYPAIASTPVHAVVAWTSRVGERSMIAVRRIAY